MLHWETLIDPAAHQQPPPAAAAVQAQTAAAARQHAISEGMVRPFPSGGFNPSGGRLSTHTCNAFAGVENMELIVVEVVPPDGY